MPQGLVVIPVIAFVLAGIAVAGLWYWWTTNKEAPQQPPDAQAASGLTSQPQSRGFMDGLAFELGLVRRFFSTLGAGQPQQLAAPVAAAPASGELVEVLRVYRDLTTGGLVVEIGGQRYSSLADMRDEQVRRRFAGITDGIGAFMVMESARPVSPAAPIAPPPVQAAPPISPAPAQAGSQAAAQPQAQPPTMAQEIENLLQYRMTLNPSFMDRSVHIHSAEDGSIWVEVDGHTYDSVSAVEDASVQAFIQKVIQEWEARK